MARTTSLTPWATRTSSAPLDAILRWPPGGRRGRRAAGRVPRGAHLHLDDDLPPSASLTSPGSTCRPRASGSARPGYVFLLPRGKRPTDDPGRRAALAGGSRAEQGAGEASSTARARANCSLRPRSASTSAAAEGLAAAAALAAVAVGVILDTGSSVAPPAQPWSGNVTRRAEAHAQAGVAGSAHVGHSQLVSLALHVRATPTPHQPGNATLVVRDNRIDGDDRSTARLRRL